MCDCVCVCEAAPVEGGEAGCEGDGAQAQWQCVVLRNGRHLLVIAVPSKQHARQPHCRVCVCVCVCVCTYTRVCVCRTVAQGGSKGKHGCIDNIPVVVQAHNVHMQHPGELG